MAGIKSEFKPIFFIFKETFYCTENRVTEAF